MRNKVISSPTVSMLKSNWDCADHAADIAKNKHKIEVLTEKDEDFLCFGISFLRCQKMNMMLNL